MTTQVKIHKQKRMMWYNRPGLKYQFLWHQNDYDKVIEKGGRRGDQLRRMEDIDVISNLLYRYI